MVRSWFSNRGGVFAERRAQEGLGEGFPIGGAPKKVVASGCIFERNHIAWGAISGGGEKKKKQVLVFSKRRKKGMEKRSVLQVAAISVGNTEKGGRVTTNHLAREPKGWYR